MTKKVGKEYKIVIKTQDQMADLAAEIAAKSEIGDVIALKGTLGAGKSFFAKSFINSLRKKNWGKTLRSFKSHFQFSLFL